MTWVKICGITNLEDAKVAVDAGAEALGFVFYEKSPRKIEVNVAREIVMKLPGSVEKVGVFVTDSGPRVNETLTVAGLTAAQLHPVSGNRGFPTGLRREPGRKTYLALSARHWLDDDEDESVAWLKSLQNETEAAAIFLDSGTPLQPGGTGKIFDWEKAEPFVNAVKHVSKLVVAGGLTPENVSEAMRILKPWGVDVSSGVEASPGKKDPDKVRAFISAVRKADESV